VWALAARFFNSSYPDAGGGYYLFKKNFYQKMLSGRPIVVYVFAHTKFRLLNIMLYAIITYIEKQKDDENFVCSYYTVCELPS
jgi:hypothetical protein